MRRQSARFCLWTCRYRTAGKPTPARPATRHNRRRCWWLLQRRSGGVIASPNPPPADRQPRRRGDEIDDEVRPACPADVLNCAVGLYILVSYLAFRRDMQPLMVPRPIDIGDDRLQRRPSFG